MLYPIKVRPLTSCHLPCHRNEIATDSHFSSQAATLVSRFSRLRCSTLDALSCTWLTEGKRETARSLIGQKPPAYFDNSRDFVDKYDYSIICYPITSADYTARNAHA